MTIAVLSDIHSNDAALGACLSFLKNYKTLRGKTIDHIIFLGDYVTDGPFPERTMDLVYRTGNEFPCTFIRGNREEYLLENEKNDQGWKKSSANGALLYTAHHTRGQDYEFYKSLPNHAILELPGVMPITIMHGSQFDVRDNYMENPARGDYSMRHADTALLLGGHSHKQHILKKYGRTYLNPGSVGFSIDGIGGHAQFSVLTVDEAGQGHDGAASVEIENFTIPYDLAAYEVAFTESGILDYAFAEAKLVLLSLRTGVNYLLRGVTLVEQLGGAPAITAPEETWKEAYRLLQRG